jgi:hypothetical protein
MTWRNWPERTRKIFGIAVFLAMVVIIGSSVLRIVNLTKIPLVLINLVVVIYIILDAFTTGLRDWLRPSGRTWIFFVLALIATPFIPLGELCIFSCFTVSVWVLYILAFTEEVILLGIGTLLLHFIGSYLIACTLRSTFPGQLQEEIEKRN